MRGKRDINKQLRGPQGPNKSNGPLQRFGPEAPDSGKLRGKEGLGAGGQRALAHKGVGVPLGG